MNNPRVFADFHNADECSRLRLNCDGTIEDLNGQNIELKKNIQLTLYSEKLEVDAIVQYSEQEHLWVAKIDWEQIREIDKESSLDRIHTSQQNILDNISKIVSSTVDSLELILYSYRIILEQIASQDKKTTEPIMKLIYVEDSDDEANQKIREEQRKHNQKYDTEGNINNALSGSVNNPLDDSPLRDTKKYFEKEQYFYPDALHRESLKYSNNSDDNTKNFKYEENSILVRFIYHQLFVNIIAQVEEFIFWIFTIILKAYPERLDDMELYKDGQGKQRFFKDIKNYLDICSLEYIDKTIEQKIKNKILDDPYHTFKKFTKYLNFENYPEKHSNFLEKWVEYAERRFRRHAAMHRGWRVNDYENLLGYHNYNKDVKKLNKFCEEKSLDTKFQTIDFSYVTIDEEYFLDTFELAYDIVRIIGEVCQEEFEKPEIRWDQNNE